MTPQATPVLAAALLAVAGCGSINLWPFGDSKPQEVSRKPANATEYQCNNDRRLYVRYLDNGASAWVIFPEREFRLDKVSSESGARYSNGIAMLARNGDEVSLRDGPTVAFTGCKAGGGAKSDSR